MPARKVSLREEAYRLLAELQKRYGATSLSDTVLLLAEKAQSYEKLEDRLNTIERKLEELEATARKTYLLLLRLLEELTGERGEGPESPAGHCEGGDDWRELSRPVRTTHAAYPPEAPRGREPRENIDQSNK